MQGPINIINFIKDKSFEEVNELLSAAPYFLKISDEDDLYMMNFTNVSDLENQICREANGVIFQKGSNKLVHYSFPKTYEGINTDHEDTFKCDIINEKSVMKDGVEIPITLQLFTEGSLIKVFYHAEWKVATSHKINATFSFWESEKSFKELFYEALAEVEIHLEDLDRECCYSFILQHPDNHICKDIMVPFTMVLNEFNTTDFTSVNTASGFTLEGPLSSHKDKDMIVYIGEDRVKILSAAYLERKELFPNNFLKWTYLNSIVEGKEHTIRDSLPNKIKYFDAIDVKLNKEIEMIYNTYIFRHVDKRVFDMITKYKKIVYQLHGDYLQTRIPVSLSTVRERIISMGTKSLTCICEL
jgi:hypothetical protein